MDEQVAVSLVVTESMLETFCGLVRRQARRPGDAIQALTAVQSFLGQVAPAALHAPDMQPLRACLDGHLEAARAELLSDLAGSIRAVLRAGQIERVADCYKQVSRSGFRQAAELLAAQSEDTERRQMLDWLATWIRQARISARGVYPDTFDYAAAGIEPASFLAAEDLYAVLSAQ